jgi:starch synthase
MMDRPHITVGHSGKQHSYRHAKAIQRLGHLLRFVTSGYYKPESFPDRLFARLSRIDGLLRRRHLETLDASRVIRRWDLEVPELAARALLGNGDVSGSLVHQRDARFDRWTAKYWARQGDIYWGFQGSCLQSLVAARRAGAIAVAEFAAVHVTLVMRLLKAEAKRHPEWADTIGAVRLPGWYRRRLEREPHVADYCIAASSFAKRSLVAAGVAEPRVKILPLGADLTQFMETARASRGTFRILFAGKIGQAKGIKYLLEAFRRIRAKTIELVLVGPVLGSGKALAAYSGLFTHLGQLDQGSLVQQMRTCDVLVLPSLTEGFGLVIPEAMATGMPVIASTHSGGPDLIEDGLDGFVLEPDDVDGLAEKLDWLATHRQQACAMGRAAAVKARTYSWEAHERRLAGIIDGIWNERACADHCHGSPGGSATEV